MKSNTTPVYKTVRIVTDADLCKLVDELGLLKSKIATLQHRENDIKTQLSACGHDCIDGETFHASISWQQRDTTNWRAIAEHLNPSYQLVTAHTTTGEPFPTVRVTSRSTS